jgi:hypothetical protein
VVVRDTGRLTLVAVVVVVELAVVVVVELVVELEDEVASRPACRPGPTVWGPVGVAGLTGADVVVATVTGGGTSARRVCDGSLTEDSVSAAIPAAAAVVASTALRATSAPADNRPAPVRLRWSARLPHCVHQSWSDAMAALHVGHARSPAAALGGTGSPSPPADVLEKGDLTARPLLQLVWARPAGQGAGTGGPPVTMSRRVGRRWSSSSSCQ